MIWKENKNTSWLTCFFFVAKFKTRSRSLTLWFFHSIVTMKTRSLGSFWPLSLSFSCSEKKIFLLDHCELPQIWEPSCYDHYDCFEWWLKWFPALICSPSQRSYLGLIFCFRDSQNLRFLSTRREETRDRWWIWVFFSVAYLQIHLFLFYVLYRSKRSIVFVLLLKNSLRISSKKKKK